VARKKSLMYKMFTHVVNMELSNYICVVDGGYLLHPVIWPSNQTFGNICDSYISYVKKNYGEKSVIIFDGYEKSSQNTKNVERLKRSNKTCSMEIIFNETMRSTVNQ